MVFVCISYKVAYGDGDKCEIPEGVSSVIGSYDSCTTFRMKPQGNYSTLQLLHIWISPAPVEAFYDLLEKLTIAPKLREIGLFHNKMLETFDFAKFKQLKRLDFVMIGDCYRIKPVYTAKEDYTFLKYLKLNNNNLTHLGHTFIKKFPMLEYISIESNKLSGYLDLGALKNSKALSLSENQITEVINTKSMLKMPEMRKIYLSKNKIKNVDFDIFNSFSNLLELKLDSNMLSGTFDLGSLSKLEKLTKLEMSHNRITRIVNTETKEMPYMEYIGFSDNKLTFLDLDDFKMFSNLKYLSLHANQLVSVSGYPNAKTIFPNIEKIPIDGNEFYCFQLEKMVAPYIGTDFWYANMVNSCPTETILFENTTCCHPYKK